MNQSKPLRVGVLGTGNWGRVHIEAYWRNPDTELVAICGSANRERAERMARQFGATAYLDFGEMLAKENLDLVSVITPDDQHFQAVQTGAGSGQSTCFFEKPLTMDVSGSAGTRPRWRGNRTFGAA